MNNPVSIAAFQQALAARDAARLAQVVEQAGPALRPVVREHSHAAMVLAIRSGRPGLVRALLDLGADPGAVSSQGDTLLMEAATYGEAEAARLLVQAGAPVDARQPRTAATAFLEAARFGQPALLRLLAEVGADLQVLDQGGANARTLAQLNDHQGAATELADLGVPEQPEFAQDIAETQAAIRAAARELADGASRS